MRRLLVLVTLTLLVGCGGQAGSRRSASLHGKVTRGPISPTCVQGQSCTKPAAGVTLRFSENGTVVARTRTSGDGSYRVRLSAGHYSVAGPRGIRPERIRVSGAGSRQLDFSIDTGIR